MLKEATLLRLGMAFSTASRHRSHVNFISDILNTKQNVGVARRTAEDLIRRVDSLTKNFDDMAKAEGCLSHGRVTSSYVG